MLAKAQKLWKNTMFSCQNRFSGSQKLWFSWFLAGSMSVLRKCQKDLAQAKMAPSVTNHWLCSQGTWCFRDLHKIWEFNTFPKLRFDFLKNFDQVLDRHSQH